MPQQQGQTPQQQNPTPPLQQHELPEQCEHAGLQHFQHLQQMQRNQQLGPLATGISGLESMQQNTLQQAPLLQQHQTPLQQHEAAPPTPQGESVLQHATLQGQPSMAQQQQLQQHLLQQQQIQQQQILQRQHQLLQPPQLVQFAQQGPQGPSEGPL